MTEERKQELRQLLNEAMESVEIREHSGDWSSLVPVDVYRKHLQRHWTSYSEDSSLVLDFNPYIASEAIKLKLLDFIRAEFAPFIHEDMTQSTSFFILGDFRSGYPLDELLGQLLKIAIGRGIEKGVSAFDRCTKNTFGSFQEIALLEGIRLETEIQVFEGIRLVPLPHSISDLPYCLPNPSTRAFDVSASFFLGKTMLIVDSSISPIFHKPLPITLGVQEYLDQVKLEFRAEVNSEDFPHLKKYNFYFSKNDFYEDFCHALSFACNSAVQISLKWSFMAEDELFNLANRGVNWLTWHHRPESFRSFTEVGETQIDEARCLYDILFNPDSNVGADLRIPIDRWVRSKTNKDLVDKMIDIGIAFESIYLSSINSKTELSFRLRLHASWHLGKDKEDRKKLMKEFRAIYDCRSDAVHKGKLDEEVKIAGESVPISEFIERAQDLCRQSILKILEAGEFPEWNDLILG